MLRGFVAPQVGLEPTTLSSCGTQNFHRAKMRSKILTAANSYFIETRFCLRFASRFLLLPSSRTASGRKRTLKTPLLLRHAPLRAQCRREHYLKIAPFGAVRSVRAPKKGRGFSRGLLSVAKSPLELLSLVTLFRNTKERNALPRQRQNIKRIIKSARHASGKTKDSRTYAGIFFV